MLGKTEILVHSTSAVKSKSKSKCGSQCACELYLIGKVKSFILHCVLQSYYLNAKSIFTLSSIATKLVNWDKTENSLLSSVM